ncbi:bile acid:sodium symporter family protein [Thalassotalea sp. PS06]|uniref:bile acid:sodium symporter family protein n=1 Tax=Thalassotalea sp. PS06 TaxID=2594005 RepID=UPI00116547BF|nr:bile acid:sodium symporter family protein [Thalassotalea sp. PS06]QDP01223.1 bile acid:sodium symporter family protein [Thalassotalea sp. PS06]
MLKNTAFTLSIFIIVAIALAFPGAFQQVGDYKLTGLIVPLLMIIMFGMGTSVGVADFVRVAKMPKSIGVGLICQYSIMPFIGMSLATLSGMPPEIAAGIILVGCAPGGLASNVMAYISGANLALSLSLTAFSTLLAPFATPLLMSWLAGEHIPIDAVAMFWSITKIVILPVVAGLLFNHFLHGKFPIIDKAMPMVSMVGIIVIIAIITAAGRDNLITLGFALIGIVALQNILGLALGYLVAKLIRMDEASARAIAFEVGMQNSGLASGIAVEMGRVATMGIAPAVFGPMMNINGSILASFWRKSADKHRPVDIETETIQQN